MRRSLSLALLIPALLLHGCGGKTAPSASGAQAADRGTATVNVAWPTPPAGRVIPLAAQSIVVQIKDATGAVKSKFTVVRPASSGKSAALVAGDYTLVATSYPTAAGTGTPEATGTGSVTIVARVSTPSDVTMGSTVTSLALSPASLTPTVGDSVALAASAKNASGAIVMVDPSTVHWTSSDPTVATVDATGLTPTLTAVKAGTATISAQFTEVEASLNQTPVNATANVAVTVNAPVTLAASSWPKFRGDAANTGRGGGSGATGTTTKWATALVSTTGGFSTTPYYFAIGADGTLFASTPEGKVIALNRTTGAQLWSVTPGTSEGAAPLAASSDGNLYAFANTGTLFALNGATGAKLWSFAAGSTGSSSFTVGSNGTIYLANGDNTVYAVKGGKQVWSYKIGATPSSGAALSALALGANGDLYFCAGVQASGGYISSLYALSASIGTKLWATSGVSANPAVGDDGTVYVTGRVNGSGAGGFVQAFSGSSGTKLWTSASFPGGEGELNPTIALGRNAMLYIASGQGGFSGVTAALNATTGATVWTAQVQSAVSPILASDGTVYVGNSTGVFALDGATGTQRWTYSPSGSFGFEGDNLAVDADGTIYATMSNQGTGLGTLYAIH